MPTDSLVKSAAAHSTARAPERWGGWVAHPLIPSLYAWGLTVAAPCLSPKSPALARAAALGALLALAASFSLQARHPVLGRRLGIHGFVGSCVITWILLGERLAYLEPIRGALGALGWVAFAFGWGTVRRPGFVPEADPGVIAGPSLSARAKLEPRQRLSGGVALVAALVATSAAWWSARPAHALLAHAVALAGAAGVLHVGGQLSATKWVSSSATGGERLAGVAWTLVLLGLALAAGFAARSLVHS